MSELRVPLPAEVSRRLEQRAGREGVSVEQAAADLLAESLSQDPFEFVGAVSDDSVTGADADESLGRLGFGR